MSQGIIPEITNKYKVLIVEDDEGLNKLIASKLERKGIETIQTYNGKEGLDQARANKNALLVLDYILPDIDGQNVVEILQEEGHERPFIVMTGFGDEKLAVEMMKMGAQDYLVKNDEFLELVAPVITKTLKDIYHEDKMKKVQRHNKYLSLITRQIFEPIFVTDKKFQITFANKAAKKIYGYTEEELQGKSILKLYPEESAEDLRSQIQENLQGGHKWRKETTHQKKDGETFSSIDSVSRLQKDDEGGIIFFHYSIMEREKIEEKKEGVIEALQANLQRLKNSEDLIPMCSNCKKIRTKEDKWMELEDYLREYTELELTHGICPNCIKELYPDFNIPPEKSIDD